MKFFDISALDIISKKNINVKRNYAFLVKKEKRYGNHPIPLS